MNTNTMSRFQGRFALLPVPAKIAAVVLAAILAVEVVLPLVFGLVGTVLSLAFGLMAVALPLAFMGWLGWLGWKAFAKR